MDSQSLTSTATPTPPELKLSIRTPAAVSALAFGKGNYLAVGAGKVFFAVVNGLGYLTLVCGRRRLS